MEKQSSPSKNQDAIDIPPISDTKLLTIKIANSLQLKPEINNSSNPIFSPSISFSPALNSPSPPNSAFVSALQSPYISPRVTEPPLLQNDTKSNTNSTSTPTITTLPSSSSYNSGGSHSDDIPSTSYTPPSERYDFHLDQLDQKPKISDAGPRLSFSFPVPRVSFGRGPPPSTSSNTKLRSCDVYIGFHGQSSNLSRFCKWLKAELELEGMASFVADRVKYSDNQSHEIADRIICSASFGVIVITPSSFLNAFSLEEIRFFAQKKNLIPLLFDTELSEISCLFEGKKLDDKECKDAFDGFVKCNDFKLETNDSNWRTCISKIVGILRSKLGRRSIAEKEREIKDGILLLEEELPFPRNRYFIGREKELGEIETSFFGFTDVHEIESNNPACGSSEETDTIKERFINLEMKKCKEPTLEAWIEPQVIELNKNRNGVQKQRSKHKKSRIFGTKNTSNLSVFCINGSSGIGKSELALEFAYRYAQRYKMVLWIGGETRYFRQNILNLSINLNLDLSIEAEKERGKLRSFEEQELDSFLRVKRELFRDIPFLIIIDNLETERDWWEGKDLHDFIPRNTGASHVIITTKLPKILNFEPLNLQNLPSNEASNLIKGRRKKDYPSEELEILRKFEEKLGRLSFSLWLVGSLLSELLISPSELFEAIERISLNDNSSSSSFSALNALNDDGFWRNNSFLMKVFIFCFALMDRANKGTLASRMVLSGAWLAPAPISSNLLASVANKLPNKLNPFQMWTRSITIAVCCGSNLCLLTQNRKAEAESALLLVKLGLAKRANKQTGCWIQLHPITRLFGRLRGGLDSANGALHGVIKSANPVQNSDHLWASCFLVFGFKTEPPIIQLKPVEMVLFIKKTALPLAIRSFTSFSRCGSALELLKVCTNVLEEVEKSFANRIQEMNRGSFCWRKKKTKETDESSRSKVDEYVWQEVTLLKASLLETRAKLLMRGGLFDNGEELCRTCISIRTVMLGHGHGQTLQAQETLAKIVRCRTKM